MDDGAIAIPIPAFSPCCRCNANITAFAHLGLVSAKAFFGSSLLPLGRSRASGRLFEALSLLVLLSCLRVAHASLTGTASSQPQVPHSPSPKYMYSGRYVSLPTHSLARHHAHAHDHTWLETRCDVRNRRERSRLEGQLDLEVVMWPREQRRGGSRAS